MYSDRMFIKKNTTKKNGKTYTNYLLVESLHTEQGPRHKVIASLGNLKSAPAEHWHQLARKVERALAGQLSLVDEPEVATIVDKARDRQSIETTVKEEEEPVSDAQINIDKITIEEPREAGTIHVGHQTWLKLGVNEILQDLGFDERESCLTEILTLNRLIAPGSELATKTWVPNTALPDILGADNCKLGERTLYTHLDKLHGLRPEIESALADRERNLLNLDDSILLYDLTSTYFEGQCLKNDQAQRGYSRDHRPDCKQVVVGLVLNEERFPTAHEVFDGNRNDTTTVDEMLDILDARAGGTRKGRTVVVDRGMSSRENLATIRSRGYHYMVATRQSERDEYLAEIEDSSDWQTFEKVRHGKYWDTVINRISIKRVPTETVDEVKDKKLTAAKKKFERAKRAAEVAQEKGEDEESTLMKSLKAIELNMAVGDLEQLSGEETLIICASEGRREKDKAIREKQEKKFLKDVEALKTRIDGGTIKPNKVHESIGRLKERYSRAARYYDMVFDDETKQFSYTENSEKKELAKQLDGSYLIRTDRNNLTDDEIWRTYMLLTRVESAFRDMKTPLLERPIFHQLERRVQTHIFICVLAYHLLAFIEKMFRDKGNPTSWETIRAQLRTHQTATVVIPYKNNKRELRIRRGTTPEKQHIEIYDVLAIPHEPMQPKKSWSEIAKSAKLEL